MSQYPPPYTPPTFPQNFDYYQPAGGQLLAPARRAGLLMMILGGLAVLASFCIGAMVLIVPMDELFARQQSAMPSEAMTGVTPQLMRVEMLVVVGLLITAGIVLLALGFFVRRGGRGPAIAAIVLCGLMTLLLGIQALFAVGITALHPNPPLVMAACLVSLPLLMLVLLLVWLVQAVRAAGALQAAQQQYQMQMWQATQQQAQAPQTGYGYGPPPGYAPPTPVQPQQYWAPPPPPQFLPPQPPAPPPESLQGRHPPLPPDVNQGPPGNPG